MSSGRVGLQRLPCAVITRHYHFLVPKVLLTFDRVAYGAALALPHRDEAFGLAIRIQHWLSANDVASA